MLSAPFIALSNLYAATVTTTKDSLSSVAPLSMFESMEDWGGTYMVKKLYSGSLDSGYTLPFHSFVISMDYFFPLISVVVIYTLATQPFQLAMQRSKFQWWFELVIDIYCLMSSWYTQISVSSFLTWYDISTQEPWVVRSNAEYDAKLRA